MQIPLIYPSLTCLLRAFAEIRAILPFAFSVVNERTHSVVVQFERWFYASQKI
jgi:hypothetical protein